MKKRIVSLLLIAALCLALCPNAPGDASRRALALGDVSSDLPEEWEEGSPDDPHGDEPGERDLPETKSFGPFGEKEYKAETIAGAESIAGLSPEQQQALKTCVAAVVVDAPVEKIRRVKLAGQTVPGEAVMLIPVAKAAGAGSMQTSAPTKLTAAASGSLTTLTDKTPSLTLTANKTPSEASKVTLTDDKSPSPTQAAEKASKATLTDSYGNRLSSTAPETPDAQAGAQEAAAPDAGASDAAGEQGTPGMTAVVIGEEAVNALALQPRKYHAQVVTNDGAANFDVDLRVICKSCGAKLGVNERTCGSCGAPAAPVVVPGLLGHDRCLKCDSVLWNEKTTGGGWTRCPECGNYTYYSDRASGNSAINLVPEDEGFAKTTPAEAAPAGSPEVLPAPPAIP